MVSSAKTGTESVWVVVQVVVLEVGRGASDSRYSVVHSTAAVERDTVVGLVIQVVV